MATHTPHSLLWLLAHSSHQFGLVELLCSMPAGDVDHEAESLLLAAGARRVGPGMAADRAAPTGLPRQRQQGRRPADRARHRRRSRIAGGEHGVARADRRAAASPSDGRRRLARRVHCARERLDRAASMRAVVDALHNLVMLPVLRPLPQTTTATADPVLAKIRALLAKAESTTFEAEALTFTAKAQELMTKHAIDAAGIHGGAAHGRRGAERDPRAGRPSLSKGEGPPGAATVARRLPLPYRPPRRLRSPEVIGMPSDLAAVDLLFTSLLVQAQTALMRATGSTRSYRSSFLYAFAGASASACARSTTPS